MDIRAFGSVYGQQANLPYASGFHWAPADGEKTFTTCRALYTEAKSTPGTDNVYIGFNDGATDLIQIENFSHFLIKSGNPSLFPDFRELSAISRNSDTSP